MTLVKAKKQTTAKRKAAAKGRTATKRKTTTKGKAAAKKKTSQRARRYRGMSNAERAVGIVDILKREYPDARCQLDFSNAFELLIATILAAQCTDAMVNRVTPTLFATYPNPQAFVDAEPSDIEKMIYKTGFFRNKTKSIQKCCRSLVEEHGGEVPRTMEELTALGGVGRKTANCVLGNVWGVPGIVVDTHVKRITNRMGFTTESDPDKIEQDLMKLLPEDDWVQFSHLITDHGRACCTARKPMCDECPVEHLCPKIGVG